MSEEGLDIRVQGADQLVRLARRMREAGEGELRRELLKTVRAEATPIVADLRSRITSLQVKGTRGGGTKARRNARGGKGKAHGLRRTIASAIQVKITTNGKATGVRIRVNTAKLPEDQKKLPKALDRPGGWRHPVFGDQDVWVSQVGAPWWESTIDPHASSVRSAMVATLDRYAAQLERGT